MTMTVSPSGSRAYHLIIDEEQRAALLELIKASGADDKDQPLYYWVDMLSALPQHPSDMIHGFCC